MVNKILALQKTKLGFFCLNIETNPGNACAPIQSEVNISRTGKHFIEITKVVNRDDERIVKDCWISFYAFDKDTKSYTSGKRFLYVFSSGDLTELSQIEKFLINIPACHIIDFERNTRSDYEVPEDWKAYNHLYLF